MLRTSSELAILERSQTIFANIESQPKISGILAEYGYDEPGLDQGRQILIAARERYDACRQEAMESKVAYQLFSDNKEDIDARYRLLRKKAKVVFRDEPLMLQELHVHGETPYAYLNWLQSIQQYCKVYIASEEVRQKLARLKVAITEVEQLQADLENLIAMRASYIKERGEAQHATQLKDETFASLDKWIREFYAIAKIALDDRPQLLETFGVVVKR